MAFRKEKVVSGSVFLGTLLSWDTGGMVRFQYRCETGEPMEAEFDTRKAFDIWIAAMMMGIVRKEFPDAKIVPPPKR